MIDANPSLGSGHSPGLPTILLGTIPGTTEGVPHLYDVAGQQLVVTRQGGEWHAFYNQCPHQGAELAEGIDLEGKVTCSRHGWEFDLRTGERRGNWTGSGKWRLAMRAVLEREGCLYLLPEEAESKFAGRMLLVRFGVPGWVAKFQAPLEMDLPYRSEVLIRTERGVEVGCVLGKAPTDSHGQGTGEVLRLVGDADETHQKLLRDRAERALSRAREVASNRNVLQEFVDSETLWEGETVVIYYLGDHGLELADVVEEASEPGVYRLQFQPLLDPPEVGGCGCGSGGCHA